MLIPTVLNFLITVSTVDSAVCPLEDCQGNVPVCCRIAAFWSQYDTSGKECVTEECFARQVSSEIALRILFANNGIFSKKNSLFWYVTLCSSVHNQIMRRHIPEDSNFHFLENLRSQYSFFVRRRSFSTTLVSTHF
jgi:hypothetical protein